MASSPHSVATPGALGAAVARPAAPLAGAPAAFTPPWIALGYFAGYRVVLAALMLAVAYSGLAPRPFGHHDEALFRAAAIAYCAFAALVLVAALRRRPGFDLQVFIAALGDIVAIVSFMHASGGVRSGFGLLLVVATAGASLLSRRRFAVLFAALGSLAVLGQQLYSMLTDPFGEPSYPHAGMLGAALFATALLAHFSARRARLSEALAERRGIDLANLAELNQHIIERMQAGIVAVDGDGAVRLMNESARALLGLGQVRPRGQPLVRLVPDLAARVAEWRDGAGDRRFLFQPRGGALKLLASFGAIGEDAEGGALIFLEDASAVQQRAQQLKLASLGRLAASIAHEIRNPLGAISHAGQLLGENPVLNHADERLIQIIRDNSVRMNTIIENVLELGRERPAQPERFELAGWLEEFAREFCAEAPCPGAALEVRVDPPSLEVRFDRIQLRQVIWNLAENAVRHAGDPPHVELVAGNGADDGRPYLDIRDNGAGIEAETSDRLFEPFYTTSPSGTGLGLYVSRELCEGNQAALNHVPIDGAGTCFRVTFSHPRRHGGDPE